MDKIFCIGSNKTGTTSLTKSLQILGYSVCPEDLMFNQNSKHFYNQSIGNYDQLFKLIDLSYLKNFFVLDLFLFKFIKKNKKNNFSKVVYTPDPGQLNFFFSQKFSKNYCFLVTFLLGDFFATDSDFSFEVEDFESVS